MKTSLPKNNHNRRPRPYSRPEHLLRMYRHMKAYQDQHGTGISRKELVEAGFASSTSVIAYYIVRMKRLGMAEVHQVTVGGRTFTPSRSVILLPLSGADPIIKNILKEEKSHVPD